jgi:1,5-anhydro-D-fructose reductase (1,5-anhydro-D-mannitol-forming)
VSAGNVVRWGLFGLGRIVSARFAPALAHSPRARLVACAAHKADRARAFGAQFGVPNVHDTFAAMLADPQVDAVYVATPNSLHAAHVLEALRAGKHVLCEKPLSMSLDDACQVVEAARAARRVVKVAYQFRLEPLVSRMRDLVAQGAIGELRSVTLFGASPVAPAATWRQSAAEGGVLTDLGVHLIDLVRWCSGLELTSIAAVATPADMRRDPVQTVTMLARLGDFAQATLRASREIPGGLNSFSLEGTHGTLVAPAWRNETSFTLTLRTGAGATEERFAACDLFRAEIDAFADELAGKRTILASVEDGLRVVEITQAAIRTSSEGGTLDIAPPGQHAAVARTA